MNHTIQQNGLIITLKKLDHPLNQSVNYLFEAKGRPTLGSQRVFSREGVEVIFNLETCLIVGNRSGYFDFQPEKDFHVCGI